MSLKTYTLAMFANLNSTSQRGWRSASKTLADHITFCMGVLQACSIMPELVILPNSHSLTPVCSLVVMAPHPIGHASLFLHFYY